MAPTENKTLRCTYGTVLQYDYGIILSSSLEFNIN